MKKYGKFARVYDELMVDFDYEEWFRYIRDIFKKYKKNPQDILEMACGTGNLSYHLAKERYDLTCFDISEDMLSHAYEKLRKYKNVDIIKADMIDFKLNKKFDSVISICDSINYIRKKDDLEKVFKNVYDHLKKDGIFIFDINSYYKLNHIIGNNTFVEDSEDVFYIWENFYDEVEDLCEFYLTFFFKKDAETYERFDEHHIERAYKTTEIVELLGKVGFNQVDFYQAFSFEDISEKTERINFVASK